MNLFGLFGSIAFPIIQLPGLVPLGITLGWEIIFYASTQVAKHIELPWYVQPLYTG